LQVGIRSKAGWEGADINLVEVLIRPLRSRVHDATVLYPSREVRDAVIKSGMEHGAAETYDKLAELLPSLQAHGVESQLD